MSVESHQERAPLVRKLDFDPAQIAVALGSVAEKFSEKDLENLILEEGEEVWGIFFYNEATHVCCDLTLFLNRRMIYLYTRVPMEALQISAEERERVLEITPHFDKPTAEVTVDQNFLGLDRVSQVCFYPFSGQVEFVSRRQDSVSTLRVGPDCRHSMVTYNPEVFK